MEIIAHGGFYAVLDVTVRGSIEVAGQDFLLWICALEFNTQNKLFDFTSIGLLFADAFLSKANQLLGNGRAPLARVAAAEDVTECCPRNTSYIKAAMFKEVLVFDCDSSVFYKFVDGFIFNGDTLNGVVVFP